MAVAGTLTYKTELDTSGIKKSGSTVKSIIAGLGITKMISSAMSTIKNSTGDAIKRLDTLNNFPRVMSNLGISAEKSSASIKKMSDKLSGLPTTLDQGASAVQRFTSANGDVEKSTDIFLALNNAILAGGASTEIQASALEQLSQSYAKGKPDMMEWRTAMTAMPAQLKQVAKAMGYVSADKLGESLRNGTVSMDEFMDTIVQLNTKGVDGFSSFEKQARNSTAGIGTAITVAKTQVVKGLADIIAGIDKGLKKSGTSISKIIADLGKKAKNLLDGIAKALSKIDFNKLMKTLKNMIPILGSVVAGMVAYKSAVKLTNLASLLSQAKSFSQVLKVLIPSLTGAKTGMVALNSAFAISPIGLVVSGVTGLIAGFALLASVTGNTDKEFEKIDSTLKEYNESMKEANQERQNYLDKNMNEIQNTENLANELKNLVDENGRVKAGYEDRVKFILGELNSALGTEITMTDGVIDNYNEITGAINKVIEAKRAKTILEAQEKVYNKAMDERVKLEENYANAQKKSNDTTKERNEYLEKLKTQYKLTKEQVKQLTENYKLLDDKGNILLDMHDKEVQKLLDLTGKRDKAKRKLEESAEAYTKNQKIIGDYQYALQQMSDNNHKAVLEMYEDTTNYQSKTNDETLKKYQGAIESQKAYLENLKKNKDKYNEDVYNAEVKATEQRIKQLEEGQKKEQAKVSTLQDQKGKASVTSYANGMSSASPNAILTAKTIANQTASKFDVSDKTFQTGVYVTSGFEKGLKSLSSQVAKTAKSIGEMVVEEMNKASGVASPSKKTMKTGRFLDEGLQIGIKQGEKETLKVANEFGNNVLDELGSSMDFNKELDNMYKEMNNTISMENSKLNFDVVSGNIYNKSFYQTPIQIGLEADLEMDKQKVGRLVTPSVVKTIKTGGGQL